MSSVSPIATLDKVKKALYARGTRCIKGLGRTFRALDSFDKNKKVDREEFFVGLQENGVKLSKAESNALLDLLDTNKDGTIDFEEFLVAIRGQLNAKRQALVDAAWLKFDLDGNGYVDLNEVKPADFADRSIYNVDFHPKVKSGQITKDQAFREFMKNFADKNGDGIITREEWNEYYAAVSASIDNDEHFVELMKIAWRLDPKYEEGRKKNMMGNRL